MILLEVEFNNPQPSFILYFYSTNFHCTEYTKLSIFLTTKIYTHPTPHMGREYKNINLSLSGKEIQIEIICIEYQ